MAQKAVDDLFIRGLVTDINIQPAVVVVNITKPGLAISINENSCKEVDCNRIIQVFNQNVLFSGYEVKSPEKADFVVDLWVKYINGETAGGLTSVYLDGEIRIFNGNNSQSWANDITQIKGVGKNTEEAKQKTFNELVKMLDKIYFDQAIDQLD